MKSRAVGAALALAFLVAVGLFVAPLAGKIARPGHAGPLTDPTDFAAFYCGGKVLARHADPYRATPLDACERDALRESNMTIWPHLVAPAPLPPYALALFSLVTFLPFRAACVAFFFGSVAAIGVGIVLAARLGRFPFAFVALASFVSLGLGSLALGQVVPIAFAGLCASALALRAGRVRAATAFVFVTLIEPHVGIAAVAGLALLVPRARVPICIGVAALAALSLAAGGVALNVEYVARVLPAHAQSEVANFRAQYGLSTLLYQLGWSSDWALRVGAASYAAMLALGLALARRLRRAFDDDAFAVVTPCAAVLFGGTFVHDHQMSLALPFAFVLANYCASRVLLYAATIVLAVPYQTGIDGYLGGLLPRHPVADPSAVLARAAPTAYLAEDIWRPWIAYVNGADGRSPAQMLAYKLPTWCALVALGVVALGPGRRAEPARVRAAPVAVN